MGEKAWPLGEPASNDRGLVRAAVVEDAMDIEIDGNAALDRIEELAKPDRAMAAVAFADLGTSPGINCSEKGS